MDHVLISETMKQNDRQDDEEQLKIHDVRGKCFAPHLALMLKSEWYKCTVGADRQLTNAVRLAEPRLGPLIQFFCFRASRLRISGGV